MIFETKNSHSFLYQLLDIIFRFGYNVFVTEIKGESRAACSLNLDLWAGTDYCPQAGTKSGKGTDKCLALEGFMSKEEREYLEIYRQLKPELKQDVLAYSHGSLSCQRRLEKTRLELAKAAEKAAVTEPEPKKSA
jgi:hypothetical protein